ncbi:MAG TPA: hypothetical protein VMB82_06330 [Acidimicrobiales bacterium]|nr:hypothetical protein [Acidimicrobiales bacterium]
MRTDRRRRATRWCAASGWVVAVAIVLAACGAGSPTSAGRRTTTTAGVAPRTTAPPPAPTTTTEASTTTMSVQAALEAAITAFQASQGVPSSSYQIENVLVSTMDDTWAKFTAARSATAGDTYQGGYGYLHQSGGTWVVVGFGTSAVGCSPQSGNVPAVVLSGFGTVCPATVG